MQENGAPDKETRLHRHGHLLWRRRLTKHDAAWHCGGYQAAHNFRRWAYLETARKKYGGDDDDDEMTRCITRKRLLQRGIRCVS